MRYKFVLVFFFQVYGNYELHKHIGFVSFWDILRPLDVAKFTHFSPTLPTITGSEAAVSHFACLSGSRPLISLQMFSSTLTHSQTLLNA